MTIHIIGSFDKNKLYCTGSLTKLLTTYTSLSLLAEHYELKTILDDDNFLDTLCINQRSKKFLTLFQKLIGSKFSIHDICTYYAGLAYTFDPSKEELENVDLGRPFKHHAIPDEKTFLYMCRNKITPVYPNRSKFHYSEISIIFLGYFLETVYDIKIEHLYHKYIIDKFCLKNSTFSRKIIDDVHIEDLSAQYDYPSMAIADHGYFCYSNGFYTTLNDMKTVIENFLREPVFNYMVDIKNARAASNRLMNGLTIELRMVKDDLIYGYEGLSFSGCNLWAYSTKNKQGYITFNESEEEVYKIIYDELLGYPSFDAVPEHTQQIYKKFIANFHDPIETKDIPIEYQGNYQRVKINKKTLEDIFVVGKNFIIIRNPEKIKYAVIYVNGNYRVKGKDNIHGAKVGLYQTKSGNHYMSYDGTLYKKVSELITTDG